ncbi:MAG: hypothetical protein HGA70_10725 [Chlorobiaceae bacterium]|jgi:hypothetical protein|nr:hypothetical protein [Chlorobiaceae bacterium]
MGIHYTTNIEGDTLFVRACGFDENLEDVQNYSMGIIQACLEFDAQRVYCDETALEYRLKIVDTYEMGKFLSEAVPKIVKIAIVCNPAFLSDASFFENVVVNRGLQLRMFTDSEAARHWLFEIEAGSVSVA